MLFAPSPSLPSSSPCKLQSISWASSNTGSFWSFIAPLWFPTLPALKLRTWFPLCSRDKVFLLVPVFRELASYYVPTLMLPGSVSLPAHEDVYLILIWLFHCSLHTKVRLAPSSNQGWEESGHTCCMVSLPRWGLWVHHTTPGGWQPSAQIRDCFPSPVTAFPVFWALENLGLALVWNTI